MLRRFVATGVAVAAATAVLGAQGALASSSGVVVSQVYGGGGNSGAPLDSDFIEVFNAGGATVPLSGWSVQYASAAGTSWQSTALSGSIAPGQHRLVKEGGGTTGAPLPSPDFTGG